MLFWLPKSFCIKLTLKSLLYCYMRLEKIFNVLKILWVNGWVFRWIYVRVIRIHGIGEQCWESGQCINCLFFKKQLGQCDKHAYNWLIQMTWHQILWLPASGMPSLLRLPHYLLSYVNDCSVFQSLGGAPLWTKKFVRETIPEAMISHTLSTQRRFCNVSPDFFCHLL